MFNLGKEQFFWFHGVVEDVDDPKMLGRIRVRVFGIHTSNKVDIPTEDLPWGSVISPIQSASNAGIGVTPLGIDVGSHVVGFFRDGLNAQDPIIMGTTNGIQNDESDVNKLARGVTTETVIEKRSNSIDENISTADGSTWSEPVSDYNATYPNNKVIETKTGHVIEIDDTPGAERLHVYHAIGSFVEFASNGDVIQKTVGDDFKITQNNNNLHVKGNVNITADGDATIKATNITIEASGNIKEKIAGNYDVEVGGNYKVTASRIDLN